MQKDFLAEKERIIEVASKLFSEKSYAGASIRDIARASHVNIAMIYYYFKDKEDLLNAIIQSVGDELLIHLQKAISESKEDPLEQLRDMVFHQISLMKKTKKRVKVYTEEQHHLSKKRFKKVAYRQQRAIYDMYVEQLKKLQRLKLIRFKSLPVIAFAIFGMVNWCYRWHKDDGEVPIEEVAETFIDLLFYGLLNTKSQSSSKSKHIK